MLTGFALLQDEPGTPLRSIHKIIFKDDKAIVLDNETEYQQILVFDASSGRFLHAIGRQNKYVVDGFNGVNDFSFDYTGDNVCALASGKMSFMQYDLLGNHQSTLPNGTYGDKIEPRSDGNGYLVYNEYGGNDISGNNYLLFYDKRGNLEKRSFPYHEIANGNSYTFTGFLTKSSRNLFFSPPFCDTIYSIEGFQATPSYTFDFGRPEIPRSMITRKATGWDFDSYAYLAEGFAQLGEFIIFEYFADSRLNYGLYNESSQSLYKLRKASPDHLYDLLLMGEIFPKDANTFAFVVPPGRLQYLLNSKKLENNGLATKHPDLLEALLQEGAQGRFLVLYFTTTAK